MPFRRIKRGPPFYLDFLRSDSLFSSSTHRLPSSSFFCFFSMSMQGVGCLLLEMSYDTHLVLLPSPTKCPLSDFVLRPAPFFYLYQFSRSAGTVSCPLPFSAPPYRTFDGCFLSYPTTSFPRCTYFIGFPLTLLFCFAPH